MNDYFETSSLFLWSILYLESRTTTENILFFPKWNHPFLEHTRILPESMLLHLRATTFIRELGNAFWVHRLEHAKSFIAYGYKAIPKQKRFSN